MNYEKMKTICRDKIYDFLVGENKEILRYKELEKICSENSGILPEKDWAEILA